MHRHSVIVDVPNNNPWNEVVTIEAGMTTTVNPLIVPVTVSRVNIAQEVPPPPASAYALPTAQQPLLLENGCASISVSQNRIIATAATTTGCVAPTYLCVGGTCAPTVVFAPITPLRSVLPFPGRQDAVIAAYGDTVAVIELNPLRPQFFAPLLRGQAPRAAIGADGSLVVTDRQKTFTLEL